MTYIFPDGPVKRIHLPKLDIDDFVLRDLSERFNVQYS